MEELFTILLFVLFVVAPLLERLRKKQPGAEPPQPGRAPRRPERRTRESAGSPAEERGRVLSGERAGVPAGGRAGAPIGERAATSAGERGRAGERTTAPGGTRMAEEAASVIPDDLWELLTGERRRPRPAEVEPKGVEARESEPAYASHRDEPLGGPEREEWAADEGYAIAEADPEPPAAERLAVLTPDEASGSLRTFVAAPLQVEVIHRRRRAPLGLDDVDDVRRAVILREVLGPPKGLE